jgi:hypothetical protein
MRDNYNKETKKSAPTTIRYNLEEFEQAKIKSGKQTAQSLFDFLLNKYVNGILMAPPAQLEQPEPQRHIAPPQAKVNPYDAFQADIQRTTYSGDLQKVMKEVEASGDLGAVNKAKLRAFADNHRTSFTN